MDRQTKGADVGETADDLFGNIGIFAMHMFGVFANHFFAEAAKGVLHHFIVVVEVTRAWRRSK